VVVDARPLPKEGDVITARVYRSGDEPRYDVFKVPYQ
jgi:hypothetical protein